MLGGFVRVNKLDQPGENTPDLQVDHESMNFEMQLTRATQDSPMEDIAPMIHVVSPLPSHFMTCPGQETPMLPVLAE